MAIQAHGLPKFLSLLQDDSIAGPNVLKALTLLIAFPENESAYPLLFPFQVQPVVKVRVRAKTHEDDFFVDRRCVVDFFDNRFDVGIALLEHVDRIGSQLDEVRSRVEPTANALNCFLVLHDGKVILRK